MRIPSPIYTIEHACPPSPTYPLVHCPSHCKELSSCSTNVPYLLSVIPRPINIPTDQLQWRKGWIEHVSHRTPEWEINSNSVSTKRILSFPLAPNTTLVIISYLRSYEGMGTTNVHACGASPFHRNDH